MRLSGAKELAERNTIYLSVPNGGRIKQPKVLQLKHHLIMKKASSLLLLLFVLITTNAQSKISITNKIVNENGEAIEYATIGIPSKKIGTLSDTNGVFTLNVEIKISDTLVIRHVSYQEKQIPITECLNTTNNIVMQTKQLDEMVVYNGKRKKALLANKGMNIAGGETMLTIAHKGFEVGSMVETKRIFELQEISFNVRSNNILGAKFSVNIYRQNEATGEFTNTLCKPIYFDIPVNSDKQEVKIEVTENVIIQPGTYFVSIMFVDYDNSNIENEQHNSIYFPLYLKSSYTRKGIMNELESIPINMGLSLKGIEYK